MIPHIFTTLLDAHELEVLELVNTHMQTGLHLPLKRVLLSGLQSGDAVVLDTASAEFKGLTQWQ